MAQTDQMTQPTAVHPVKLGFRYESDASASFLVLSCDAKLLEYQALMLEHNRIRHVLPVDVVIKEGIYCYYYNITSKISLAFYLGRRKLNREEFLKLLLNIASVAHDSAGYLLSVSNFVFDPEYLFINPETLEPMLVYVPAMLENGCGTTLQNFISDLLMLHINVDGFNRGNLVQRILAEVKSESFNTKSLIHIINDLLYAYEPDWSEYADDTADNEEEVPFTVKNQKGRTEMAKAAKAEAAKVNAAKMEAAKAEAAKAKAAKAKAARTDAIKANAAKAEAAKKKAGKTNAGAEADLSGGLKLPGKLEGTAGQKVPLLTVLLVLLQVFMGAAIYAGRNFLNHISHNPAATYAAVIMVVLAIDLLLIKKLVEAKLIHIKPRDSSKENTRQSAITAAERVREMIRGNADEASLKELREYIQDTTTESTVKVAVGGPAKPAASAVESTVKVPVGVSGKPAASASEAAVKVPAGVPLKPVASASGVSAKSAEIPSVMPVSDAPAARPAVTSQGKTELLASQAIGVRMLKCTRKQDGGEDILIDKDDFIIGRLSDHVDYVLNNNAVGKLHAQLLVRNGTCYIKDLNSVNGTFINSKRIESNKEVELKNNDRVLLANLEFIYIG